MESLNDQLYTLFLELPNLLRYLLIFGFAFGEGLPIIGSFLPGGTVAIIIGALSKEGFVNPWLAIHIIAIGSLLGDLIGFFAGKKLLHIKKIHNFVYSEKQAKNWDIFDRHAALVIILGKLLPLIRSTPALFAGARNMNIIKYISYVLIGSYIWAIAGIFGGQYLSQIFGGSLITLIFAIIGITIIISFISYIQKNKKKIHTH